MADSKHLAGFSRSLALEPLSTAPSGGYVWKDVISHCRCQFAYLFPLVHEYVLDVMVPAPALHLWTNISPLTESQFACLI